MAAALILATAIGPAILVDGGSVASAGTFPGTNGLIAYDELGEIRAIAPDGSNPHVIVTGRAPSDPDWSADGQRIAYEVLPADDICIACPVVQTVGADGSGRSDPLGPGLGTAPSWSPDGTRIALARPFDRDLAVMSSDGSNLEVLLPDSTQPAWSPDGTRIAVSRQLGVAADREIWVVDADGTDPVQVTDTDSSIGDQNPVWSPDGTRLAFERAVSDGGFDIQVWVMHADGSNAHAVGVGADTQEVAPAWSPDGTRLAFVRRNADFDRDIWTMAVDGTDQIQLTTSGVADAPSWQSAPDQPPPPPPSSSSSTTPRPSSSQRPGVVSTPAGAVSAMPRFTG